MQVYQASFSFDHVPPVLKRGRHALLVIQDAAGKYLLGSKHIYPPGISRFIGGGIEASEDPQQAAARELQEEVGLFIPAYELEPLARVTAEIDETTTHHNYLFDTFLYHVRLKPDQIPHPGSDLNALTTASKEELEQLIKTYQNLSSALISLNQPPYQSQFRWSDYGKFYSQIHDIGLQLTTKRH